LDKTRQFVMPGLVPGTHDFDADPRLKFVDGRDKPGHDRPSYQGTYV
jgi:hypothetical protein